VGRRRRRLENRGRPSRRPRVSSRTTDATDSHGTSLRGLVSVFSALVTNSARDPCADSRDERGTQGVQSEALVPMYFWPPGQSIYTRNQIPVIAGLLRTNVCMGLYVIPHVWFP